MKYSDGPPLTRRSVLGLGMVGAGAVLLPGCSAEPAGPESRNLEVMFWGTQDQIAATRKAFDAFTTANPGTTINPQFSAYEGYFDKLATRVAGGNPPDIFQIDTPFLADYTSRGVVAQLDAHATKLGLDKLPASVKGLSRAKGHDYFALVGGITQPGMCFNAGLLADLKLTAPKSDWTLDDFTAAVKEVARASNGTVWGTNDFGAAVVAVESYMNGRGKALYTEDGKLGFSKEDFAAWLSLWDELRKANAAPPMSATAAQAGFQDYPIVKNKSVYSQVPTARGVAAVQALTKATITMTTFPAVKAGGVLGTTVVPVAIWAVSAKTKATTAATDLLTYLGSSKDAAAALGIQGGVPFDKTTRDTLYPDLKPADKAIVDVFGQVSGGNLAPIRVAPKGAAQVLSAANSALVKANQSVGFGQASVEQAVNQFFETAERTLGK